MKKKWIPILSFLVLTGALIFFWKPYRAPLHVGATVTVLENSRSLSDFRLESTRGPLTEDYFQGHWTFLLFGYTHCPDVCPTDLALLAQVTRKLHSIAAEKVPQVLFVSVDGSRDTLDVLGKYVPAFHPDFVGATGSDAALKPFTRDLGMYYVRNAPSPGTTNYSVDHTSAIFFIGPDGAPRASFRPPLSVDQTVKDVQAIMSE